MALLNIQAVSPQMNNDFNVKVLNYKVVDDGKFAVSSSIGSEASGSFCPLNCSPRGV